LPVDLLKLRGGRSWFDERRTILDRAAGRISRFKRWPAREVALAGCIIKRRKKPDL
jgi:hypothetical protein